MINYLKVENLAVVKIAELSFSPQLNILTGETGAGKSILIDAIQLLMHKKIPAHILRSGSDRLVVEALFSREDEEFLLKREIENNRSVAFINGEVATFQQVKNLANSLLNIYGQKDHAFLLQTANHQAFLDEFAGHRELLGQVAEKFRLLRRLQAEYRELSEKSSQIQQRTEELAFQIQEIENLNMKKGDEALLKERLKILAASESIIQRADQLVQDLYQKEQSIYQVLAQNRQNLEYLRGLFPEFSSHAEEVDRLYKLIPEVSSYLNVLIGKLEFNEGELNEVEGQLQKLDKLKAKHKLDLDQILDLCEEMRGERDGLVNLGISLRDKEREMAQALEEYRVLNRGLRESRDSHSGKLAQKIEQELAKLEMKKAKFQVRIEESEPAQDNLGEKGTDAVEFYFTSNPGQDPGPLAEVASGGELSRLMLVLKSLGRGEREATYIFDEIDAGIGGKTAEFVGEKLRQIAAENQVICISHLPQIASFADRHFMIAKEFRNNQTFSTAKILGREERTMEIARLMAGSSINADVLKAAEGLLQKNGR